MNSRSHARLDRSVGTWGISVAGIALVVASTTLVTDFVGFVALGWGYALALVLAFVVILPLALAVADVSVSHPHAGAIYHFARRIIGGSRGAFGGLFLAFCFFGMFLFAAAAETTAGAYALRSICDSTLPVELFIVALALVALVPNLFGLRTAAGITAGLLVVMLGVRWFFGLAGFCGWSATGEWNAAHLVPVEGIQAFGGRGIVSFGLALGFWTFVGIEGACSLAEDTRNPARSIPRGLLFALLVILASSLFMGIGATGTLPLETWGEIVSGPAGNQGESPQLAFGEAMFGPLGRSLMAVSSLAATVSTLTVAFAAVPRMLFGIARDGLFFGRLSPVIARLHSRTRVPVNALLLTVGTYLALAVWSGAVVECLYSAAYLWIFRYLSLQVLAIMNRVRHPQWPRPFRGRWFLPVVTIGILGLLAAGYFGFAGRHLTYAPRALVVTLGALSLAALSFHLSRRHRERPQPSRDAVPENPRPLYLPAAQDSGPIAA